MTNFTAPLYASGAPVLPGGGLIRTGNWWFVDAATGSDGNPGTAQAPLASLAQAQINAVANNGDVVVLLGTVAHAGADAPVVPATVTVCWFPLESRRICPLVTAVEA